MREIVVIKLEESIKGLVENLSGFEGKLDDLKDVIDAVTLSEFQELFEQSCRNLTQLRETLEEGPDEDSNKSLLIELIDRLNGTLLAVESSRLDDLLDAEALILKRLELSGASIKQALKAMDANSEMLPIPQGLEFEDVIKSIREFEETVCAINDVSKDILQPKAIKVVNDCVSGMIQVCVIAGDVVSVFTFPDPTPFTFLRSVKSVCSGVSSLHTVTNSLKKRIGLAKSSPTSANRLPKVRKRKLGLNGNKSARSKP